MNVPQQYLIHIANRGPETFAQVSGDPGKFKCFMKQPLKDINKFGLMMYSIPKTLDILQRTNQQFNLVFEFESGQEVIVPVTIPRLDYYDMYISQEEDKSGTNGANGLDDGQYRSKKRLSFDEVLQTSINWAIMEQFDQPLGVGFAPPLGRRLCDDIMSRIGCIVQFVKSTGCFKFLFGYKGMRGLAVAPAPIAGTIGQAYNAGVLANSGAPCPTVVWAAGGAPLDIAIAGSNGTYEFVSPDNHYYRAAAADGNGGVANGYDPVTAYTALPGNNLADAYPQIHLTGVRFSNVPQRLQYMLGLDSSHSGSNIQQVNGMNMTITRGRMILVNYSANTGGGIPTGLIEFPCPLPPNLDPPSFLYLQLLVPGTRSKILGQSDERGGWALPTTQNMYMSKYDNLPKLFKYDPTSSRLMPAVTSQATYDQFFANTAPNADGIGFNFDPIPVQGGARVTNANWSLTPNNDRSRFIRIGGTSANGDRNSIEAGARKRLRSNYPADASKSPAFGVGLWRQSSCFTTTLIEPNWLYTSVENVTMQTVDAQLMFGDTSETVETQTGQPVQFTIIASP